MLPTRHPLEKTAIEVRRALQRLENLIKTAPHDKYVTDGAVSVVMRDLESIKNHIPKELQDTDIQGVT